MIEYENKLWADLDWPILVERIQKYSTSELARGEIARIAPLKFKEDALQSFSQIQECEDLLKKGLRPFLKVLTSFLPGTRELKRRRI